VQQFKEQSHTTTACFDIGTYCVERTEQIVQLVLVEYSGRTRLSKEPTYNGPTSNLGSFKHIPCVCLNVFWSTVCKTVRPMLSDRCLSCPVLSCLCVTFVHCGQTVGRIKMKLGMQVGLGPGHIVLDGDPLTPPQRANPQFLGHICCGHMAAWIKMSLGMELRLDPGDFVLDGDTAPSPKRGQSPVRHF